MKKELAALNKLKQQIAKEQKKKNKQAIKRVLGVWPPPPPSYPHKSRSFAMDVFVDVSRSRSDGRCGKSVEWAPCALVPTGGRSEATPCCNFQEGKCTTVDQCGCPHCVNYAFINKIAHTVKTNAASRAYSSDAFGFLQKNKDMYMKWVVDNIASQRLLQKILRMVETQTQNVINVFNNKYERGCGNKLHKLSEPLGNIFANKIAKLQASHNYPGVFDLAVKHYLQLNVQDACLASGDIAQLLSRVHKSTRTIQKATMKITSSADSKKDSKQFPVDIDLPAHFASDETRRERKIKTIKRRLGIA
jgi:hypothetical protein